MVIENKVKIGSSTYEVKLEKILMNNLNCDGCIDFTNETIELQEDMDLAGNYAKKVFIHEIVHGILEECGLKQDEDFVLPFSNCLYSVIKDNPKIFNPNTHDID